MATTTKTLRMTFVDGNMKKVNLTLTGARDNLAADEVRNAMQDISAAGVFTKQGVDLYSGPQSAAYVERTVTDIFDDSADNAAEQA